MGHVFRGDFHQLDSEERQRVLPAKHLLQQIGIKKGDTVLDFGAGIGYFSIPALEFVGATGKVIAIDRSERMLDELRRRAKERANLQLYQAHDLDAFTVDVVLLVTVLHEVDDPKEFLTSCFTHLNPGGRLVVIEWDKKETPFGPPVEERIAKADLLAMANRPFREHPIHEYYYFIVFS